MVDYGTNNDKKHNLEQKGNKYLFSIKDLGPGDAGLYQVDVEDANVLSTSFKGKFMITVQDSTLWALFISKFGSVQQSLKVSHILLSNFSS